MGTLRDAGQCQTCSQNFSNAVSETVRVVTAMSPPAHRETQCNLWTAIMQRPLERDVSRSPTNVRVEVMTMRMLAKKPPPRVVRVALVCATCAAVVQGYADAQTAPVQSFVDLAPLVKPGDDVVVLGTDGRKTRGRIVLVSGDTLEIRRPPRFFGAGRRQVFT